MSDMSFNPTSTISSRFLRVPYGRHKTFYENLKCFPPFCHTGITMVGSINIFETSHHLSWRFAVSQLGPLKYFTSLHFIQIQVFKRDDAQQFHQAGIAPLIVRYVAACTTQSNHLAIDILYHTCTSGDTKLVTWINSCTTESHIEAIHCKVD